MASSPYSQHKFIHHIDTLQALKDGRIPPPVHVQLILSDLCNQDCHFCAYRMSEGLSRELFATARTHNPNRKIETIKAIEIIEDCAALGVKAIQFTGGGEPTVHKDHLLLFDLAQSLGIKTALVTNGVKLKPEAPVMDMEWIRVSIDAGTPETYSRVRNVSKHHWKRVWSNIEALGGYKGKLGIGFVVTDDNFTEIADCARMARDHGADSIRIGAVFSKKGTHYYHDIDAILSEIEKAKEIDIEVIDLFGRRINDLEVGANHQFCGYQYFTTYIGADLSVYRCCNTAYTKKGFVGSLKETRFRNLKPLYEPFDARTCTFCQFRGQNDAINEVLDVPEHVEFV